jgi:phosphoketolase
MNPSSSPNVAHSATTDVARFESASLRQREATEARRMRLLQPPEDLKGPMDTNVTYEPKTYDTAESALLALTAAAQTVVDEYHRELLAASPDELLVDTPADEAAGELEEVLWGVEKLIGRVGLTTH